MPSTAERFGIDSLSSPQKHIEAGVKYIQWLDGILLDKITDREERIKFVIAAYNVGLGHVLDARRLAEKYKKDPNIWTGNVDYFILHKSNPEYYQDPVVKYGYCRGEEPYRYVTEILDRFKHYSNFISE
jgi:membrane-bound lytic murein transglycosylase F